MKDYKTSKDRLSTPQAEMLGSNVVISLIAMSIFLMWATVMVYEFAKTVSTL